MWWLTVSKSFCIYLLTWAGDISKPSKHTQKKKKTDNTANTIFFFFCRFQLIIDYEKT